MAGVAIVTCRGLWCMWLEICQKIIIEMGIRKSIVALFVPCLDAFW